MRECSGRSQGSRLRGAASWHCIPAHTAAPVVRRPLGLKNMKENPKNPKREGAGGGLQPAGVNADLLEGYFKQRQPDTLGNLEVWFVKGEGLAPAWQRGRGGSHALWSRAAFKEAKFRGSPLLLDRNNPGEPLGLPSRAVFTSTRTTK